MPTKSNGNQQSNQQTNGDQQTNGKRQTNGGGRGSTEGRSRFTLAGMEPEQGREVAEVLQRRLVALLDLQFVLKHIHWNVVGPTFIGVHEMLDPQVDAARTMTDDLAERIAALGVAPDGRLGVAVAQRTWDDYSLGRDTVMAHLGALDLVYEGVASDHRSAIEALDELDMVSQDLLIGQTALLDKFHWFVRAHLENASGQLLTAGATNEVEASRQAASTGTAPGV